MSIFYTPVSAQLVDYYVNIKTWDVYGGGTDNHIEMEIFGDKGQTGRFYVVGSSERDMLEGFSVRKSDVGKITKIMLDVDGQLADKWSVEFVTVTKNSTDRENRNSEDGFYEFSLKKDLDYDPVYFTPTYSKDPRLQLKPDGSLVINKTYYTKVNFGHNPHATADQGVMQYSETWQFVESVSLSSTEETTVGAAVTASYESPESVYGKFGVSATASWQDMVSKTRTTSQETMRSSTYDWSYVAPANTSVFKKIVFEIPYGYQVYTDGIHKRILRKLNSQVVPSGLDQFLFIPKIVNGQVVPILWSEIENEWLQFVDPKVKTDIERQFRNTWLANAWVVIENKPQPTPPTPTPVTDIVNGYNVNKVIYTGSDKGSFEQTGPGEWAEYKAGSRTVHAIFTEQNRDEWSVYLLKNDGARIQIDLHKKQMFYNNNFLFNISSAQAD
ncbi:MAG: hypothetical protein DHS20C18_40210 [Saprospiraceae bacterium]|nr:MAG: hypothetical protein DHS20C18_40210 [Saprospiraceae bacterium]